MKTNMKTALYVILFVAGCAQAQQSADSRTNLTVTDINGRVLMTNASYTCMYKGQLFFGRGCLVEGFAATNINPTILSSLGLDLNDIEAKGREDVKTQQVSAQAFQRYAEVENEKAARRAEAQATRRAENEKAALEAFREEMLVLSIRNLEMRAAPVIRVVEPRQIVQSSVTVLAPQFDSWNRSSRPPQTRSISPATITKSTPVQRPPPVAQPVQLTTKLVKSPAITKTTPVQRPPSTVKPIRSAIQLANRN
jgi:hypothetical protein